MGQDEGNHVSLVDGFLLSGISIVNVHLSGVSLSALSLSSSHFGKLSNPHVSYYR